MADLSRMTVEVLAGKLLVAEHGDWLGEAVAFLLTRRRVEVEQACGAGNRERSPKWVRQRQSRPAPHLVEAVGEVELPIDPHAAGLVLSELAWSRARHRAGAGLPLLWRRSAVGFGV